MIEKTKELLSAVSALLNNVRNYTSLFDEYRHYLIGNDFPDIDQHSYLIESRDIFLASETLKKMDNCLCRIVNDMIEIKKLLAMNKTYSKEEIDFLNSYVIDLNSTSDLMNKRINLLKDPDKLLLKMNERFMKEITTLDFLIKKYNEKACYKR